MPTLTIGVLALQGGFEEHINHLRKAAATAYPSPSPYQFNFIQVRTPSQLESSKGLILPGGESTTISLVAAESGLLEPLRDFVKHRRNPVWGTCAGAILLADEANATSTKKGGQALIGGLSVRVHRNHFGRQVESFIADLDLPFLSSSPSAEAQQPEAEVETAAAASSSSPSTPSPFQAVFIRAPIVEAILPIASESTEGGAESGASPLPVRPPVETLAVLPGRKHRAGFSRPSESDAPDAIGDIVAVRQGNVFATSFHPELTDDVRIHVWWLREVVRAVEAAADEGVGGEKTRGPVPVTSV
ncbi:SNO glutamine amidotransferase [Sodiomyces alkalinus F11]|uniref:glutaminase n=1 Tax=Sodiomyces alkalinus (strain CBS 110278 / VKM F-3762 / F11) TaxID=1314773 RepID=A0A3N2Q7A0_SODAK|nr:SNO glutamine amidotransferase [Sodiomyces alkalinus F11]ROT42661.1 SNO glutamine amidotransferase [Sodiomyces alkalinus F11]